MAEHETGDRHQVVLTGRCVVTGGHLRLTVSAAKPNTLVFVPTVTVPCPFRCSDGFGQHHLLALADEPSAADLCASAGIGSGAEEERRLAVAYVRSRTMYGPDTLADALEQGRHRRPQPSGEVLGEREGVVRFLRERADRFAGRGGDGIVAAVTQDTLRQAAQDVEAGLHAEGLAP